MHFVTQVSSQTVKDPSLPNATAIGPSQSTLPDDNPFQQILEDVKKSDFDSLTQALQGHADVETLEGITAKLVLKTYAAEKHAFFSPKPTLPSEPQAIVLDATHRMILVASTAGKVMYGNDRFCKTLGPTDPTALSIENYYLGLSGVVDLEVLDFGQDDNLCEGGGRSILDFGIQQAFEGKSTPLGKVTMKSCDASQSIPCNVITSPTHDIFGEIVGVIVEARDITEALFQLHVMERLLIPGQISTWAAGQSPMSPVKLDPDTFEPRQCMGNAFIKVDKKGFIVSATLQALERYQVKNFPEPIANESPASQKARVMKALPMLNMLIGKAFATNCSAETDWDQIREATAEAVTGQPAHLLINPFGKGKLLPTHFQPAYNQDGEIDGAIITEAEEGPAAIEVNRAGIITHCTAEAAAYFGLLPHQLIGTPFTSDCVRKQSTYQYDTNSALEKILATNQSDFQPHELNDFVDPKGNPLFMQPYSNGQLFMDEKFKTLYESDDFVTIPKIFAVDADLVAPKGRYMSLTPYGCNLSISKIPGDTQSALILIGKKPRKDRRPAPTEPPKEEINLHPYDFWDGYQWQRKKGYENLGDAPEHDQTADRNALQNPRWTWFKMCGDGENQMEEAFDQEGHSKNYKILTYPGPVTFQQFRSYIQGCRKQDRPLCDDGYQNLTRVNYLLKKSVYKEFLKFNPTEVSNGTRIPLSSKLSEKDIMQSREVSFTKTDFEQWWKDHGAHLQPDEVESGVTNY